MGDEIRNFLGFVTTVCVVGLGIALIGITQDRPGPTGWQQWHVVDYAAAEASGLRDVALYPGPEHCGWEEADFLYTSDGEHRRYFVRDPEGVFPVAFDSPGTPHATGHFRHVAPLPRDAVRSGWSDGFRELWLARDGSYAYVTSRRGTEAWAFGMVICY